MTDGFKWYDAHWLNSYHSAKQIVATVAPSRLDDFVRAFNVLRTDPGFKVREVPDLFGPVDLARIEQVMAETPAEKLELHEIRRFGRFIVHDNPVFTEIQQGLVSKVSELVGEPLEASYNFLSMYTQMGVCEPHLDAPSAKWTLDICISQSEPWPIHFSQIIAWPEGDAENTDDWQLKIKNNPSLKFETKSLTPGDAIVFSGSSQWHYRDPLSNLSGRKGFCNLLFLHFIPEGTGELVDPRNWASLFGIPELQSFSD